MVDEIRHKLALDKIKRLEAEVVRLREQLQIYRECTDQQQAELERLKAEKKNWVKGGEIRRKRIEELEAEVERLNRVHVDLMICMDEPQKVAARHIAEENELRAEVERLKEEVERLKEENTELKSELIVWEVNDE